MALPPNLTHGLLSTEAEYLATSDVLISITPLMRMDRVRLLDGVYGPLRPPMQARVPLWMALNLKKRKRCTIVCPEWMERENLKDLCQQETQQDEFGQLPLHYMAIAKVLLETAPDDIADSDDVRALLKSIREARQSKVLSGIEAVNTEHLAINNVSLGEVTELRRFLGTAFQHLRAIQRAGEPDEPETSYAQAEIDDRHYSSATHIGTGTAGAADLLATPTSLANAGINSRTPFASGATPTWSRTAPLSYGDDGDDGGVREDSANNMDLF